MTGKQFRLGDLKRGDSGTIVGVEGAAEFSRFLEMGLLKGSRVQVMHEAPFTGDPIAVRVRGSLIALRRNEANSITVVLD